MIVSYACPRCEVANRATVGRTAQEVACKGCGKSLALRAADPEVALERCLICSGNELYVRKAFPQRLGVAIVALGFLASSVAWYYKEIYLTFGILGFSALCDVALYLFVGDPLVCYRCGAQYRAVESMAAHGPFSLDTHERYRQEAARRSAR